MQSDKELMQMALDAVEEMARHFSFSRLGESRLADTKARGKAHQAIEALRARLAQPEQRIGDCLLTGVCAAEGHRIQKAQPEPEPVVIDPDGTIRLIKHSSQPKIGQAPVAWIGLTDEEVFAALVSVDGNTKRLAPGFVAFYCAIEAKLKEKNS